MSKIPVSAAKEIAKKYDCDQVLIFTRKVDWENNQQHDAMAKWSVSPMHDKEISAIARQIQISQGWPEKKIQTTE